MQIMPLIIYGNKNILVARLNHFESGSQNVSSCWVNYLWSISNWLVFIKSSDVVSISVNPWEYIMNYMS